MRKENKRPYEAPMAELIELENFNVLCGSGAKANSTQTYNLNNQAIVV